MHHLRCALAAFAAAVSLPALAAAEPVKRELYVLVEFDAQQSWAVDGEYPGQSEASSSQTYEVRLTLRSDGHLYTANLLDPDLTARLKAKTVHLARKALRDLAAQGKSLGELDQQALTRRMQEEQVACGGDAQCRHALMQRYVAIFAALQYPEALKPDREGGRYRYFEPYAGCESHWKVRMTLDIEGSRAGVPFTEHHAATSSGSDDEGVALCERYLAVIDSQDQDQPLYLENFFLPSATGLTTVEKAGEVSRSTETQPMPSAVLDWVTAQLKHAPVKGHAAATVPLPLPLNGVSVGLGSATGTADVELTWHFLPAEDGAAAQP